MIYPVLEMVFENYEKVGLELDNVFNAHNDKTIGGQRGKCHVYMTSHRIIEGETGIYKRGFPGIM